jgi:hypothetical protein
MPKKFSDLESDEKRLMEDELASKSQALGMSSYESYGINERQNLLEDMIGLCATCKSLQYCKTEFGNVFAKCMEFKIKLTGQNRITECNLHSPMRMLTLEEMYSIAYLIESDNSIIKGFISNDKKLKGKPKKTGIPTS